MAQILKNHFVKQRSGIDFSRNIFPYEKRHSTNLLSGFITPVHVQFLYPGDSPDWNFGCVIESAPLISTCLDNIYVDIVCIWTPIRLVMTDFNEWLGESHTQAFTINRNIVFPKLTKVDCYYADGDSPSPVRVMSRAYLAEHYLAPHIGFRRHGVWDASVSTSTASDSIFKTGVSVLPSRIYELNWNSFFRNENIQTPILIDKTNTVGSRDYTYHVGLGKLQIANKLKNFYTVSTPAPSLLDVSIALDQFMAPVMTGSNSHDTTGWSNLSFKNASNAAVGGTHNLAIEGSLKFDSNTLTPGGSLNNIVPSNLYADLSALTVNRMYYALMEQRFANKMMKGRRAVEFYQNFFGIRNSESGHDMPELIIQKRYPLNISQVVATASGNNGSETTDLGQKGAFSTTGFGGSLCKNFMATEHGYMQTYMIIRGQPSLASGIDKHLGYSQLLDTYLVDFDHIGPVGIEMMEIGEGSFVGGTQPTMFGYTNAWYERRKQVSDVVGILEPDEPLAYKTLAMSYIPAFGTLVISDAFLRHDPRIIDRIFLYPVCYDPNASDPTIYQDSYKEPYNSNRYQFITQFVVKGTLTSVLSIDSEPLRL